MKLNSVMTASLVVMLSCAFAATAQEENAPAPAVKVGKASKQSITTTMTATGTVVSRNDARIAAETPGRLTWVAEPGTQIERGGLIARIDDANLKLRLRENDATIARLEANRKYQDSQVARFQRLIEQKIASQAQLEETVAQRDMTAEEINLARVTRDQTLHDLERARVTAPFAGQVVERLHQLGEFVAAGGEVARLVDTGHVEVRAQAPMQVASFVRSGSEVRVVDHAGREVRSPIRAVIPVGDERSRQMEVRVALPDGMWPIGSPVSVELPTSSPLTVVAVPRDAVILRNDDAYILRVTPGGKVERVPVSTGIGSGGLIEVKGKVSAGDRVVIRGGERLQPGQSVAVIAEG
ncbi:MAG TPA: efflux RND transporter periplasmic adaptor subunit [Steroidobacteraceae bacterium]|nr:efflux RND transporter periplasmic adaptor subunit [Steroidobacteraceae bacterium]